VCTWPFSLAWSGFSPAIAGSITMFIVIIYCIGHIYTKIDWSQYHNYWVFYWRRKRPIYQSTRKSRWIQLIQKSSKDWMPILVAPFKSFKIILNKWSYCSASVQKSRRYCLLSKRRGKKSNATLQRWKRYERTFPRCWKDCQWRQL